MKLSRRDFIAAGGALAATVLAPGSLLAALDKQRPAAPDLSDWSSVRSQFRLAPDLLHFSSFYLASHPRPVREAIDGFRQTLDANPYITVEHSMFESEIDNLQQRVREAVAEYLGGQPDEVALTGNTTTGLALVYHGLHFEPGDEVLTTTHDHYSHHESIRLATSRAGATWRKVPLFDRSESATTASIVERVRSSVRPRTRVLGVTWVHSSTGMRLPIRAIADALAQVNRARPEKHRVLLVVDGVHGLGAVDETVADLGADYFCAGTHKWMFAPRGTGIVWARPDAWARVCPIVPTFSALDDFGAWMNETPPAPRHTALRNTPGGFAAYEHQWAMVAAFQFHRRLGRPRVAARIRELNDRLKAGLAKMPRVQVHTPLDPALSAGLVAFEVQGLAPGEVVKKLLERRIVASTSPYRVTYARLAPSLVNTPEEVDVALAALRQIAAA